MADIQPKNTNTVRVDVVKEKTPAASIDFQNDTKITSLTESGAGLGIPFNHKARVDQIEEKTGTAGVLLNTILKIFSNGTKRIEPLTTAVDLGTSALPFNNVFLRSIKAAASILIGPTSADKMEYQTNGVVRETLTATGTKKIRLSHVGYTSGGEIEEFTAGADSVSVTPVLMATYTIGAGNTQIAIFFDLLSRDNAAATQSRLSGVLTASRAGGGAVAGTVTVDHTTGAALHTITLVASGNDIQIKIQNVGGANTTSALAHFKVIPVSTIT